MAATFVVEDGTGLATANSYLSEADADTYWDNHGAPSDWTGADSATKQEALRMATQYLDLCYGSRWIGHRTNPTVQALDWPQYGVELFDGILLDSDEIPTVLQDATAEAAIRHITETDGLMPDTATDEAQVQSETTKVGPITISQTFAGAKSTFKRFIPVERLMTRITLPKGTLRRG